MATIDELLDVSSATEYLEDRRVEEVIRTCEVREQAQSYAVTDPDGMAEVD